MILSVRNYEGHRVMQITMDLEKGKEKLTIEGLNGDHVVVMDSTKGQERMIIRDKAGSFILMDSVTGILSGAGSSLTLLG